MTHTEALEAAARALNLAPRASGYIDRSQVVECVVAAYLTAFGVRDLGALVEAAGSLLETAGRETEDGRPVKRSIALANRMARLRAALTAPAQIGAVW